MTDESDAIFRAQMGALARKGGETTKRRYGSDPRYYRSIGSLGGKASAASRKYRIAVDTAQPKAGESPRLEALSPEELEARPVVDIMAIVEEMEGGQGHLRRHS